MTWNTHDIKLQRARSPRAVRVGSPYVDPEQPPNDECWVVFDFGDDDVAIAPMESDDFIRMADSMRMVATALKTRLGVWQSQ